MVDSEGSEAMSSSESYVFSAGGTIYADMEKEGLVSAGEGEDMVAYFQGKREGQRELKEQWPADCLAGDQSICFKVKFGC